LRLIRASYGRNEKIARPEVEMDIIVRGRHIELSQRFRDHVTEKVAKLDRFGVPLARIDVEVTKEQNPRLAERAFDVELTCRGGAGSVIRAEAASADQYAALELAYDRLEERLRRAADRRRSARRHGTHLGVIPTDDLLPPGEQSSAEAAEAAELAELAELAEPAEPAEGAADAVYVNGPIVVREKTHESAPMSVGEAVDRMELVGHDFYLFTDSDTSLPSVVYRRVSFDYGLIRLSN